VKRKNREIPDCGAEYARYSCPLERLEEFLEKKKNDAQHNANETAQYREKTSRIIRKLRIQLQKARNRISRSKEDHKKDKDFVEKIKSVYIEKICASRKCWVSRRAMLYQFADWLAENLDFTEEELEMMNPKKKEDVAPKPPTKEERKRLRRKWNIFKRNKS